MKKVNIKGWHFWLAYAILIVAMLVLLNGCAATAPADMKYRKAMKSKYHKELNVIHCNRE